MPKKKSKKPTWSDIKASITGFDRSQFINLIKDLYQLSETNRSFLNARYSIGSDPLQPYKKKIYEALYLDVMDEKDDFDFDRAERAIKDYMKATGDSEGTADLMIYYVERGNKFTLDYGDINEFFYDALVEMYEKAIKRIIKMHKKKQGPFRKRLEKIMLSSDGIGWGYHDNLCHLYYEAFQQN